MNEISDKEISERYKNMNRFKFADEVALKLRDMIFTPKGTAPVTFRANLFYRLLNGWNDARINAGFSKMSAKRLASAINGNPFLKDSDSELELLIKSCEEKGNYKKAHWTLFPSKKKIK